jgi:hypothetical protein
MTNSNTPPRTEELRDEIARTRADLGDTAAALAAKADVKTRAKESAARAGDRAKETAASLRERAADEAALTQQQFEDGDVADIARRPVPVAVLAVVVAAAVAVFLIRRARR